MELNDILVGHFIGYSLLLCRPWPSSPGEWGVVTCTCYDAQISEWCGMIGVSDPKRYLDSYCGRTTMVLLGIVVVLWRIVVIVCFLDYLCHAPCWLFTFGLCASLPHTMLVIHIWSAHSHAKNHVGCSPLVRVLLRGVLWILIVVGCHLILKLFSPIY